jgi:hypothetical protein
METDTIMIFPTYRFSVVTATDSKQLETKTEFPTNIGDN